MDLRLISSSPAEVESECLVVLALDHGDKQKSEPKPAHRDSALGKAMEELVASGEITGKAMETALLHRPGGLKAKRLLVVGGGKAKSFGAPELRRAAGTAIRFLKTKTIKSCALALPELASGAAQSEATQSGVTQSGVTQSGVTQSEDALRAAVEGALVADFDPDTYRSERKDLSMKEITIVAPA